MHSNSLMDQNEKTNIQFSTLDALRGPAAITIALFHFSGGWAGYLVVEFFLVLSGFILSHNYLYRKTAVTPVEFISHRLARMYPLHIYTLCTFIVAYGLTGQCLPTYTDGNLFTFVQQLTLTHNIGFNPHGLTWNRLSWLISVVFWVNLFFILFITRKTKNRTLFLGSLLGFLIIYNNNGHLDVTAGNYYDIINSGLVRGFSSFFLGILAYRIYLHYQNKTGIIRYCNFLEIICVVGVFVIVLSRSAKHSGMDFLAPFLFMFAVSVFAFEHGFISSLLKKFRYLGMISYSIYLNQITVLIVSEFILNKMHTPIFLRLFIYIVILLGYSHFTYNYIEKPLRRKGRNVLSRIVSGADPSTTP